MPPQAPTPDYNPNPVPQPPQPPAPPMPQPSLPPIPPAPEVPQMPVPPAPQPQPFQQPLPPVDPNQMMPQPMPSPAMPGMMPPQPSAGGGSKKKMITLAVAVVGVTLLAVGGYFLINAMSGGLALREYSTDEYTVMVPKEYEEDTSGTSAKFEEKTDDKDTQSSVEIDAISTPDSEVMSKDEILDTFEEQLVDAAENQGEEVADLKTDRITHKGQPALLITAIAKEKGEKSGEMRMLIVAGDEHTVYMIVASHKSDPGLAKQAEKITDSLTVK